MKRFKVILLLNWGLGLEILKTIDEIQDVEIDSIITKHNEGSSDIWENAVFEHATRNGFSVIPEQKITFSKLGQKIKRNHVNLLLIHSFMKKIPKEVYTAPQFGSINIHPSLLPKYRGPSPNYWVLKNRESVTGLTAHFINDIIDGGDIICQVGIPVEPDDDISSLIERQKECIERLLLKMFECLRDRDFQPIIQKEGLSSYAPKNTNKK